MSLLALCYPKLKAEHQRFIDEFREHHDHAYRDVVKPHFTIVFQVHNLPESTFSGHAARIASVSSQISFTADGLNARKLAVAGTVEEIAVVEYNGNVVTDLQHFRKTLGTLHDRTLGISGAFRRDGFQTERR